MNVWQVRRGAGIESLAQVERPTPTPGPHDVLLRLRAAALNHRDLLVARDPGDGGLVVPGSDAAGEVLAVGSSVQGWAPGDRAFVSFYPHWIDGPSTPENSSSGFGGGSDGLLAERVVVPAQALVRLPEGMDLATAATLPCAGVTAWNALFEGGRTQPGDNVLLLGTGGVAIWALQLAVAAGLRVILTSSDDAKLERARALGAAATINYRRDPDWDAAVRSATGGHGVELVLETSGEATLARSVRSTRKGGRVAIIGGTSGGYGGTLEPWSLVLGARTLTGILVGSRAMGERLARFVAQSRIDPLIDRRYGFAQLPEAYARLAGGQHMGKVVVEA